MWLRRIRTTVAAAKPSKRPARPMCGPAAVSAAGPRSSYVTLRNVASCVSAGLPVREHREPHSCAVDLAARHSIVLVGSGCLLGSSALGDNLDSYALNGPTSSALVFVE